MKKIFFISAALIAICFSSCQKCYDCEAYDYVENEVWDTETICNEQEREDYEEIFNDPTIDSRAKCTAQ
jgi:hypothetical protein